MLTMTIPVDAGPTVTSAQDTAVSKVAPLSGGVLAIGWAAAALANAVTFTPLLGAWFFFTGQKYVDSLLAGTGLGSSYLEVSDRSLTVMGFEILVRSANWWALSLLVGIALGILGGLILFPVASFFSYVRRRIFGATPNASEKAKAIAAWGIVGWAGGVFLFVLYTLYAIVFVTPDRATCVGETQFKAVKQLVVSGCSACGTFGKAKTVGLPLLHGKERTAFLTKGGALYLDTKDLTPAAMPSNALQPMTLSAAVLTCSGSGS